jgi:molybdopterin-containing oxidoreductase family iron-sulfur binding subunit
MPAVATTDARPPAAPARRGFVAALLATLAGFWLFPKRALASAARRRLERRSYRWGMAIDLDRCTGCQACVVACRQENNVAVAGPERTEMRRAIFWMDMLEEQEGEYPNLRTQFIPAPCNHCDNPPCIKVCPTGATRITAEGIVAQIFARCIGCRYCTIACPYTRRYFNWDAPGWSEDARRRLNPDVSIRPAGVVEKCTFCHQRIRAARERVRLEGRELADRDVQKLPACAESCPADAIVFGNLDDPESKVARLSRSDRTFRLQEELGTRPKVFYLQERKWRE